MLLNKQTFLQEEKITVLYYIAHSVQQPTANFCTPQFLSCVQNCG